MEEVDLERGYKFEESPGAKSPNDESTQLACWKDCMNWVPDMEREFKCVTYCGAFS